VLTVLFLGAFVMGCAEMLVVGMIELIAEDLAVTVPAAGALVTANALGLALGGPLLTFVTTRVDGRVVLVAATTVFVLANLLPALAAGYPVLVAARVVIGAAQGLFIAAAMVTATAVVPRQRAGRAVAVVITGFATASAVGLPLGTLLGQAVGWSGSFVAVVALGVLVLAATLVVLPSVPSARDSRALGQVRYAFAPRVLAVLALSLLVFVAVQAALTYLVPFLAQVSGISGPVVTTFLLAYGVATAVESFAGGRFADASAARALVVGTVGVTASLATLAVLGANAVVAAVAVVGLGLFGMGMAPSIQHRVVSLAGPGAPLASSLPASVVNAGIAGGAYAGGLAITVSGVPAAVLTGALVAAGSVAVAWATSLVKPESAYTAALPATS
jgi:MFS transporter, DHA1 family, inner membrane transport protein